MDFQDTMCPVCREGRMKSHEDPGGEMFRCDACHAIFGAQDLDTFNYWFGRAKRA